MTSPLYALRDEVAQVFHPPFPDSNEDSARRSFADAVNSGKVPHARDYSLWLVGSYSTASGEITPCVPSLVVRADSILEDNTHE